jgi:hypothetical protein
MLRSLLRYIHLQPKAVRNKYAFALSATFTSVVAIIWVLTGVYSNRGEMPTEIVTERASPLSSALDELGRGMAAVRGSLAETEALVEDVRNDPRELQLTDENRTAVTDTVEASVPFVGATSSSSEIAATSSTTSVPISPYQEVQIVTTSSRNQATSSATTTP